MRSIFVTLALLVVALLVWFAFLRDPSAPLPEPQRTAGVPTAAAAPYLAAPIAEPTADSARWAEEPNVATLAVDPAPTPTRIVVRVVARDTNAPLVRARVGVRAQLIGGRMSAVDRTTGTVGETLWTDAEGRATFDVRPGQDIALLVSGGDTSATAVMRSVGALRDEEERAIVVELDVDRDHDFYARVLERTNRAPVGGATILSDGDSVWTIGLGDPASVVDVQPAVTPAITKTDADGVFHVPIHARQPAGLTVESPGFGAHWIGTALGHETAEKALEVLIDRGAILRVGVTQVDGAPLSAAAVRLEGWIAEMSSGADSSPHYLDPRIWSIETDARGVATFVDLPPNVELRGAVVRGSRRIFTLADPLRLAPGEERSVTWPLGAGSEIRGVVREADGTPVPKFDVWLQRATTEADTYFRSFDESQSRRTARTDADGVYRFADVAPGGWWVGPHAPGIVVADPAAEAAPLARRVEVTGARVELDIALVRGLVIRGTLRAPNGGPAVGGQVHASRTSEGMFLDSAPTKGDTFVVGPLLRGTWSLLATSGIDGTRSLPVEAEAGATDVVLQFERTSSVRLHVVDAEGTDAAGASFVVAAAQGGQSGRTDEHGVFLARGLVPGPFGVSATTADGRCATRAGLSVAPGEEAAVELRLEPGVVGRLRCIASDAGTRFCVERDGLAIAYSFVMPGNTAEITLPIGRSTLRAFTPGGPGPEHAIDVTAGSSPEFVYDGGWR